MRQPEQAAGGETGEATKSPITEHRLLQAYDYWQQKASGRLMPRRADIDPTEIPTLLRDIMLVEVHPDGRYRYRLIGTKNTETHGLHAIGRYVDEILPGPEYKRDVLALYDECVRSRQPLYTEFLFFSTEDETAEHHTKVLFLPLAEDGEVVNLVMVMRIILYIDQETRSPDFSQNRPYKKVVHALL